MSWGNKNTYSGVECSPGNVQAAGNLSKWTKSKLIQAGIVAIIYENLGGPSVRASICVGNRPLRVWNEHRVVLYVVMQPFLVFRRVSANAELEYKYTKSSWF